MTPKKRKQILPPVGKQNFRKFHGRKNVAFHRTNGKLKFCLLTWEILQPKRESNQIFRRCDAVEFNSEFCTHGFIRIISRN
jgi:hypothetical protein